MTENAQRAAISRPGRKFLVSGIFAVVCAIVFELYLIYSHSQFAISAFASLLTVGVALSIVPFLVAFVAYFYALRTGFATTTITHGLIPLMRRNWRWGGGAILWISSAAAFLGGIPAR